MPSYDASHFTPPAPTALVALRHPQSGEQVVDVALLIDTGADITLLPSGAVDRLRVPHESDGQYELMGFDGSKSFAPSVRLQMILLNRTFRGRFLLIDQEQGILGRDILNHLSLVVAGPSQQWWEYSP